jgi:hypothetical protein
MAREIPHVRIKDMEESEVVARYDGKWGRRCCNAKRETSQGHYIAAMQRRIIVQ